jgi:UDP-N-acetylmuramoyl-tripeptide--D-alanyl-D-alanine ligase
MRVKLGIPLSLRQIADACGGHRLCEENTVISHVSTDTREIYARDLFIALPGKSYNGSDFIDIARQRGAVVLSSEKEKSHIYHQDTRQALLNFASNYIGYLPYLLYKIGITGSVGKTTTKEFLKIILSQKYLTHTSEGNFNNEIGMPMSILSSHADTEIMVMELGMSALGEIGRLSKCLSPNIGIITNIGSAHIGLLGSRENIARAKSELTEGMRNGKITVPKDEEGS